MQTASKHSASLESLRTSADVDGILPDSVWRKWVNVCQSSQRQQDNGRMLDEEVGSELGAGWWRLRILSTEVIQLGTSQVAKNTTFKPWSACWQMVLRLHWHGMRTSVTITYSSIRPK